MPGKLEGKVAIVTGGNDGIGEATARRFAQEGAKVAIMARREPEGLKVQEAIRSEGGEATFIYCDVTDSKAVGAAVDEAVSMYGAVNVLINNAGGGTGGFFPDEADDTFDATVRLNLYGTFYMSKTVWPHLVEAGGCAIVNVSSVAAVVANNKRSFDAGGGIGPPSAYAAAKGESRPSADTSRPRADISTSGSIACARVRYWSREWEKHISTTLSSSTANC